MCIHTHLSQRVWVSNRGDGELAACCLCCICLTVPEGFFVCVASEKRTLVWFKTLNWLMCFTFDSFFTKCVLQAWSPKRWLAWRCADIFWCGWQHCFCCWDFGKVLLSGFAACPRQRHLSFPDLNCSFFIHFAAYLSGEWGGDVLVAIPLGIGVCDWCSWSYFLQLDSDLLSCSGSVLQLGMYEEMSRYCKAILYLCLRKTGFSLLKTKASLVVFGSLSRLRIRCK